MPTYYEQPLSRIYTTGSISSLLLTFFGAVVYLVLPFIVAIVTGGFWLRSLTVSCIPEIRLSGPTLLRLYTDDPFLTLSWSSDPVLGPSNIFPVLITPHPAYRPPSPTTTPTAIHATLIVPLIPYMHNNTPTCPAIRGTDILLTGTATFRSPTGTPVTHSPLVLSATHSYPAPATGAAFHGRLAVSQYSLLQSQTQPDPVVRTLANMAFAAIRRAALTHPAFGVFKSPVGSAMGGVGVEPGPFWVRRAPNPTDTAGAAQAPAYAYAPQWPGASGFADTATEPPLGRALGPDTAAAAALGPTTHPSPSIPPAQLAELFHVTQRGIGAPLRVAGEFPTASWTPAVRPHHAWPQTHNTTPTTPHAWDFTCPDFELSLYVDVGLTQLRTKPSLAAVLRFAWVQYFPTMYVFYAAVLFIKRLLLGLGLVRVRLQQPPPRLYTPALAP